MLGLLFYLIPVFKYFSGIFNAYFSKNMGMTFDKLFAYAITYILEIKTVFFGLDLGMKNHLKKHISKDTEDGKGYHYEYDRLDGKNNNPEKSAFYKLTGTVAYDALKNDDGTITEFSGWFAEEEAVNAYLKAVGRTNESYQTLNKKQREEILGTYVVPITSPGTFVDYTSYQVYTKTAEMTSYGYMTRDANTCVNSTYKRQNGTCW